MKKVLHRSAALPSADPAGAGTSLLASPLRKVLLWAARRSARARFAQLRRDLRELIRIEPLFVAANRQAFFEASSSARSQDLSRDCSEAVRGRPPGGFHLHRFCLCCNETMPMLVDDQYGRVEHDGRRTVNWRERLVCAGCGMNNRQRLVAKLVQQCATQYGRPAIYLMEQVTPIFDWVRRLERVEIHGSEYLGHEYASGVRIDGVRHEDVMHLSYPDESFDMIVSNDVLEHIPDPERALRECLRVLRPGGTVLATFPFHCRQDGTTRRARVVSGAVEHLLPAQHHGNPVSSDGSLVFSDFGWDLLDLMRQIGFSPAQCESYGSDQFGHLGPGLLVFRMGKPNLPVSGPGGSDPSAVSASPAGAPR